MAEAVRHGVVSDAEAEGNNMAYRFTDGGRILVSKFLAAQIGPGDEIAFPLLSTPSAPAPTLHPKGVSLPAES